MQAPFIQIQAPNDFQPQLVDVQQIPYAEPPEWVRSQRFPDEEIFAQADQHAVQVAQCQHESFKDLLYNLVYATTLSEIEVARVIFRWMTTRDMNSIEFGGCPPGSPEELLMGFKDKKSTYCRIFEVLCLYSGIPCLTVVGYAKGIEFRPGHQFPTQQFNHSWNVVFVNGAWQIIDCHWATRYLQSSDNNVAERMVYEYDDFYFCPDPERLIYSHFPQEPKWQLLRKPLSMYEFEDLPIAKSAFFRNDLRFLSHHRGVVHTDNGALCLSLGNFHPLAFTFKLLYGDACRDELNGVKLTRYGIQDTQDGQLNIYLRAPVSGFYYLTVYASQLGLKSGEMVFNAVCEFKIVCDPPYPNAEPYPFVSDTNWGPGPTVYQAGLIPNCKDAVIIAHDGHVELDFEKMKPMRVLPKLHSLNTSENQLEDAIRQDDTNHLTRLDIDLPVTGEYALEIYANDPEKDGNTYTHVCQYLLVMPPKGDNSAAVLYQNTPYDACYNIYSMKEPLPAPTMTLEQLARGMEGAHISEPMSVSTEPRPGQKAAAMKGVEVEQITVPAHKNRPSSSSGYPADGQGKGRAPPAVASKPKPKPKPKPGSRSSDDYTNVPYGQPGYDPSRAYDTDQRGVFDPVTGKYMDGSEPQYGNIDPSQVRGLGQGRDGQYGQDPTGQYGQDPAGQYGQDPTGQYGQDPTGQYTRGPDGKYGPGPDGKYGPGPDGKYGPGPDGKYGPGPGGKYGPGPDGKYGPGPDGKYGPGPDGKYGPGPDGKYGPGPDGKYGPGPDGLYAAGPDGKYGPGPDGKYGPGPDGKYGPGPDGKYGPGPDGLYAAGADGQYGRGPDDQYLPEGDGRYGPGPDGVYPAGADGRYGQDPAYASREGYPGPGQEGYDPQYAYSRRGDSNYANTDPSRAGYSGYQQGDDVEEPTVTQDPARFTELGYAPQPYKSKTEDSDDEITPSGSEQLAAGPGWGASRPGEGRGYGDDSFSQEDERRLREGGQLGDETLDEDFPPPPPASDMLNMQFAPERKQSDIPIAPQSFEPTHIAELQIGELAKLPKPAPPKQEDNLVFRAERAEQFKDVDTHAVQVAKTEHNSFRDLIWDLVYARNIEDDLEKARVIFLWLCTKDLNQMAFRNVKPGTPEEILLNVKQGKATYAQIYETLCSYAGLHCRVIRGYAKGAEYRPGMRFQGSQAFHAWNGVLIYGEWRLIDCHWASRRMFGSKGAESIRYELDDYYFCVDPRQLAYTHFPEDAQWQLLEHPYQIHEFEDLPLVKSLFFRYGLQLESHLHAVIQAEDQLALTVNHQFYRGPGLEFTFSLQTNDGEELIHGVKLSRFGVQDSTADDKINFWIRPPAVGLFKLAIYAREVQQTESNRMYCAVIEYLLDVVNVPEHIVPFPECSGNTWGISQATAKKNGVTTKFTSGVLYTQNGHAEIRFKLGRQLLFSGKLKSSQFEERDLQSCILYRTVGETAIFSVSVPARGEYGLEVFVNDPAKDGKLLRHMCQYLVVCEEEQEKVSGIRFPQLPAAYLGPQQAYSRLGLKTISNKDPLIHCVDGDLEVTFETSSAVRATSNLIQTPTNVDYTEYILQQFNNNTLTFLIRLPAPGIYKFQIFAQPLNDQSESLPGVYNYLINCNNVSRTPVPFPKQFSQWKEGCTLVTPVDGNLAACQSPQDPTPDFVYYEVMVPGASKVAVVVGNDWTHLEKNDVGVWCGAAAFQGGWGNSHNAALTANYGGMSADYSTLLEYKM